MAALAVERAVTENLRVRYLGHAGFEVAAAGVRVLVDPWFGPAFLDSWWPSPPNHELEDEVLDARYDAVYVSHLHADHFDRRFLARLARGTPVLCPSFRSRSLARAWRDLGFTEVTLLDHGAHLELTTGLELTMVHDTSHREDSGLLIEHQGFRFLDLNDCLARLGDLPERVDLLARQYSGATWYPHCYRYPAHVSSEKVATARGHLLDTLVTTCEVTGARWYLPSAGPPGFRDPQLVHLNERRGTIFPVWEDVAAAFAASCPGVGVLRAAPGDSIIVERGSPALEVAGAGPGPRRPVTVAPRAAPAPTRDTRPVATEELVEHLARRQRRARALLDGFSKVFTITTEHQCWRVHLGPFPELDVEALSDAPQLEDSEVEYDLSMPTWVLHEVLAADDWEDALLSMRITLARDPDEYDVRFLGFLRYAHSAAIVGQLVADLRGSDETFEYDGLRIQRFCPHAGEDLSRARIEGGVIECPRHHWRWDVESGVCLGGGNVALRVEVPVGERVPVTAGAPASCATWCPAG